ncbi:MAG: hypothetical protein IKS85_05780 [Lachnospiraceae bacterium]|nr:hypothetical protein [Lachnospiraceae bacterium]
MKKKIAILLCACALLAGCAQGAQESVSPSQEQGVTQSQQSGEVAQGVKKLGTPSGREIAPVELRNEWEKAAFFVDQVFAEKKESVLVSPLSLNVALGMTAEGASGETATELYRYLGGQDYADWVDKYMSYAEKLESQGSDAGNQEETKKFSNSKYSFSYQLANSIWIKNGYDLKEEYCELMEKKFRATAKSVDFGEEADETVRLINKWCDEKTKGLIKEVVSKDMFTPELMAILINSVYFESPWRDSWTLTEHEFTNQKGEKTTQEMLGDTVCDYYENQYCTAFAKPYYNGFTFIGILPKTEGDFNLSDLDLKSLMESHTTDYDVHAICPKLAYETTADNIVDILKAEGVLKPFDSDHAEFHNLIKDQSLYISDILQKCRIELDEEGTRAAAVTAIFMDKATAIYEPREFKEVSLDRPFAYLIYDEVNDVIVFAGKVTEIQ